MVYEDFSVFKLDMKIGIVLHFIFISILELLANDHNILTNITFYKS